MRLGWWVPATLVLALGCDGEKDPAVDDTDPPEPEVALFEQLGGEEVLRDVISGFVGNVADDATINWMFANSDLDDLESKLYDQVCEATGGGCTYGGGDMISVHANMAITETQWSTLLLDFINALNEVADREATSGSKAVAAALRPSGTFDGSSPVDHLINALSAMHDDIVTDPDGEEVYFNQLGGISGVRGVMDSLLEIVAEDARINSFFAATDLGDLNDLLVEQVCEATGGYCVYSGRSMLDTHRGLCISDADFDALVGDLLMAIDDVTRYDPERDGPDGHQYSAALDGSKPFDALLNVLAGMRGDIVETCNR